MLKNQSELKNNFFQQKKNVLNIKIIPPPSKTHVQIKQKLIFWLEGARQTFTTKLKYIFLFSALK